MTGLKLKHNTWDIFQERNKNTGKSLSASRVTAHTRSMFSSFCKAGKFNWRSDRGLLTITCSIKRGVAIRIWTRTLWYIVATFFQIVSFVARQNSSMWTNQTLEQEPKNQLSHPNLRSTTIWKSLQCRNKLHNVITDREKPFHFSPPDGASLCREWL
jgi:hypothetical protein